MDHFRPKCLVIFINKCHVCLGSYNKTAEHAKQQGKGAEERRRAAAQGSRQGREGRGPSRATKQGSRAGKQGKAAGQGRGAGQGAQSRGAGQDSKAARQGSRRNSTCKRPQRGEHLSKKMLTSSRFVNFNKNRFANGHRGANNCQKVY